MDNRIFFKASVDMGIWNLIEIEDIKNGDKIKMMELSPNKSEVMSEVFKVTGDYNSKSGCFEGDSMTVMYLVTTPIMKEMFENANKSN